MSFSKFQVTYRFNEAFQYQHGIIVYTVASNIRFIRIERFKF